MTRQHSITRLQALYAEATELRDALGIQGSPGENLFDNGLGWNGDLDHELRVIANGLGGATIELFDQGCCMHSKHFETEDEALTIAMRLFDHAQGEINPASTAPSLAVDDVEWDT